MSKKIDHRLLDANAMVLGGGVGLAALESMFNLVQTQSLLSASMVRDHDLSSSLSLEALALALGEVLDPGLYASCRSCRCTRPIRVDIPPVKEEKTDEDINARRGAASKMRTDPGTSEVDQYSASDHSSTMETTNNGVAVEELIELFSKLLGTTGDHTSKLMDHLDRVTSKQLMVS